jgi:hypothetical protein
MCVDVSEREIRELTGDERIECGFAETVHGLTSDLERVLRTSER